jgi:hypothetical protein
MPMMSYGQIQRTIEVGADQSSGSITLGLFSDSCFGECPEQVDPRFDVDVNYTLTRIRFEDAGTSEEKIENEHLIIGQFNWQKSKPWILGLSSRVFLVPDQGLQSRGGELKAGYEWLVSNDENRSLELSVLFGQTKYDQRISFSTRRGTAEFNQELTQKSRGLNLSYMHKDTRLSFSYTKYSYEEDVKRFLDFLNRPVGDFLLGPTSGWVRGSQDQNRQVSWQQNWSESWSSTVRAGRSQSLSDLETVQSFGAEVFHRLTDDLSVYAGFDRWKAEGDAEPSRFGYTGLVFY